LAAPFFTAHAKLRDKVTAETPEENPITDTGVNDEVVVPSPSWPLEFVPQHFSASLTIAQDKFSPAVIAVTPLVSPATCTGEVELVLVPSPN
jgi:hypothetical protein